MAHEQEDPKNILIVVIGLGSMLTLIGTMYALGSYYDILRDEQQQAKVLGVDNPDLLALRQKEEHVLTGYAKLDNSGRTRIPVEEAMKKLAQRGRDAFPQIKPDPAGAVIGGAAATSASAASSGAPSADSSASPARSAAAVASGSRSPSKSHP